MLLSIERFMRFSVTNTRKPATKCFKKSSKGYIEFTRRFADFLGTQLVIGETANHLPCIFRRAWPRPIRLTLLLEYLYHTAGTLSKRRSFLNGSEGVLSSSGLFRSVIKIMDFLRKYFGHVI